VTGARAEEDADYPIGTLFAATRATFSALKSRAKPNPSFAAEWMSQWRAAAPALQEIRDRELREMSDDDAVRAADVALPGWRPNSARSDIIQSGLIEQQAWFMRLYILQTQGRR
jgi:hypothetical protein